MMSTSGARSSRVRTVLTVVVAGLALTGIVIALVMALAAPASPRTGSHRPPLYVVLGPENAVGIMPALER
jgi:hypothetical protein